MFFRQFDFKRAGVVADVNLIARFRNGDDFGLAQHPGERNLSGSRIPRCPDFLGCLFATLSSLEHYAVLALVVSI